MAHLTVWNMSQNLFTFTPSFHPNAPLSNHIIGFHLDGLKKTQKNNLREYWKINNI